MVLPPLPPYPSLQSRKSLSPSQLATVNQTISSSLLQTIALPPSKRDTPAARSFVSDYLRDAAHSLLQGLIWKGQESQDDKIIRKRVLTLVEKLAGSPPGLEVKVLLDLAVAYSSKNSSRVRSIFLLALQTTPSLQSSFEAEVAPAFTAFLSPGHSAGLYGLRKTAYCLCSLFYVAPLDLIRPFSHNKQFVLALARTYDEGLAAVANSYGGMQALVHHATTIDQRELDEWESIWIETKVALMDTFHILLSTMLKDVFSASGQALAAESGRTSDIVFALLDLPPPPIPNNDSTAAVTPTPFLNRPLLTDYQQSYNLSRTLASALRHAAERDARLDLLESTLQSLSGGQSPDAGALKLLLRGSGVPPGIDNLGRGRVRVDANTSINKGKGKALASVVDEDPELDIKVTQVLDILPEHAPEYIRALLTHPAYSYHGNAEKVIEALLEGTAPGPEDALQSSRSIDAELVSNNTGKRQKEDDYEYTKGRRNVFDNDVMDLSKVHIGKRSENEETVLRDRTFIEQMKADILRRAEEISSDEEDEDEVAQASGAKGKGKQDNIIAFDEDADLGAIKVLGDGEDSGGEDDDENDEEGEEGRKIQAPETILELAYIRDPKLFERDAQTRRGKARGDLKAQTGWSDEQIEGWRIMLERNPRKDKILQKHEFAGNRASRVEDGPGHVSSSSVDARSGGGESGSRGRGQGRGGRGRGRGRGGRGGGGGDGAEGGTVRERAWKDKNKASRGNHNRKRGHDKKMAQTGPRV